MTRSLLLITLAVLALTALGGVGVWVYWQQPAMHASARAAALAEARARWAAHGPADYEVAVRNYGGSPLYHKLDYTITDDTSDLSDADAFRYSMSDRLDRLAEPDRQSKTVPFRCGNMAPGCLLAQTTHTDVRYDAQFGYPRHIEIVRTEHPDWFNGQFWHWLVLRGGWRECENLICTASTVVYSTDITITPLAPAP